jgi:Nif-specific regulatory protein
MPQKIEEDLAHVTQERDLYWRLLELGVQTDLQHLLEEALSLIVGVTQAKKGYVAIYGSGTIEDPRYSIAQSCSDQEVELIQQSISKGIVAQTMSSGQPVSTPSAQEDPRFQDNSSVRAFHIEAVLCVPIALESPLGVLYLQNREGGPFTSSDLRRAEAFARHLAPSVERLFTKHQNKETNDATRALRQRLQLDSLVGKSKALADVFTQVESATRFDISILLTGSSGTGKTALAKAMHDNSQRADKAFIELNCAALPENLFESELFGAMAGAHSTATRRLYGKLAAAQGGTLFLDEIGELSLNVQSKLLQFLQSKEYYPLGSNKAEKADVRLITATNANLKEAITKKTFREDLFYRLNVMVIRVPSLSDRKEDIRLMCEYFCQEACKKYKIPPLVLSPSLLRTAEESQWPGNLRQLGNSIEAATIRASVEGSTSLEPRHLFQEEEGQSEALQFQEATKRFQKKFLREALEANEWNLSEVARRLGLARSHVHHLVQTFELKAYDPRKK